MARHGRITERACDAGISNTATGTNDGVQHDGSRPDPNGISSAGCGGAVDKYWRDADASTPRTFVYRRNAFAIRPNGIYTNSASISAAAAPSPTTSAADVVRAEWGDYAAAVAAAELKHNVMEPDADRHVWYGTVKRVWIYF